MRQVRASAGDGDYRQVLDKSDELMRLAASKRALSEHLDLERYESEIRVLRGNAETALSNMAAHVAAQRQRLEELITACRQSSRNQ